jgi:hypothetical protein
VSASATRRSTSRPAVRSPTCVVRYRAGLYGSIRQAPSASSPHARRRTPIPVSLPTGVELRSPSPDARTTSGSTRSGVRRGRDSRPEATTRIRSGPLDGSRVVFCVKSGRAGAGVESGRRLQRYGRGNHTVMGRVAGRRPSRSGGVLVLNKFLQQQLRYLEHGAGGRPEAGAVRVRSYFTGLGPSDGGRSLGRVHLRRIGRA